MNPEDFARRGAAGQKAVDELGAGSVERAGWRIVRVDDYALELEIRGDVGVVLARARGGDVHVDVRNGIGRRPGAAHFHMPAAAAAYIANWLAKPFVPPTFTRADELDAQAIEDESRTGRQAP